MEWPPNARSLVAGAVSRAISVVVAGPAVQRSSTAEPLGWHTAHVAFDHRAPWFGPVDSYAAKVKQAAQALTAKRHGSMHPS